VEFLLLVCCFSFCIFTLPAICKWLSERPKQQEMSELRQANPEIWLRMKEMELEQKRMEQEENRRKHERGKEAANVGLTIGKMIASRYTK